MKKIWPVYIIALVAVLAFVLKDNFSIKINSKNEAAPTAQTTSFETKEDTQGPVSIAVTPSFTGTWNFAISLNTHSEELDMDLVTVSELIDDKGKSYTAVSWEGAPPGGHHRNGTLKFNPISPKPKSVELKVKNIGGVERSFKWIF